MLLAKPHGAYDLSNTEPDILLSLNQDIHLHKQPVKGSANYTHPIVCIRSNVALRKEHTFKTNFLAIIFNFYKNKSTKLLPGKIESIISFNLMNLFFDCIFNYQINYLILQCT